MALVCMGGHATLPNSFTVYTTHQIRECCRAHYDSCRGAASVDKSVKHLLVILSLRRDGFHQSRYIFKDEKTTLKKRHVLKIFLAIKTFLEKAVNSCSFDFGIPFNKDERVLLLFKQKSFYFYFSVTNAIFT